MSELEDYSYDDLQQEVERRDCLQLREARITNFINWGTTDSLLDARGCDICKQNQLAQLMVSVAHPKAVMNICTECATFIGKILEKKND